MFTFSLFHLLFKQRHWEESVISERAEKKFGKIATRGNNAVLNIAYIKSFSISKYIYIYLKQMNVPNMY